MTNITIFIQNDNYNTLMEKLLVVPCFITRELIEMDYSEIGIKCRLEDAATVERIIAPFV